MLKVSSANDNYFEHFFKPEMISCFPSQIAWLCRHPELDKFDVSSVRIILTGGSTINPIFEKQIFEKLPNLMLLNVVRRSYFTFHQLSHCFVSFQGLRTLGNGYCNHKRPNTCRTRHVGQEGRNGP